MGRIAGSIGLSFALMLLSACSKAPEQTAFADWDKYVTHYLDAYFASHPDVAIYMGRHEFDGKLPDFSRQGLDREIARLHSEREHASAFANDTLDQRQRFERDYMLAVIDGQLFWLEKAQDPYRNPRFYGDAIDPNVYLTRPYAPLDQRMRAFVSYARGVPGVLEQVRSNLRTPMPRTYVNLGKLVFGGLATYLEKDVPGIFTEVKDEQL